MWQLSVVMGIRILIPTPSWLSADAEVFRRTVLLAEKLDVKSGRWVPPDALVAARPTPCPLVHFSLASGVWPGSRLAVERESHSLLEAGGAVCPRAWNPSACFLKCVPIKWFTTLRRCSICAKPSARRSAPTVTSATCSGRAATRGSHSSAGQAECAFPRPHERHRHFETMWRNMAS